MISSIIPDAKHQQLNISFTFQQQQKQKLTIKAVANHTPYEIEVLPNPHFDFQEIKTSLLSKEFKLVSITVDVLKLKIGLAAFEFKNVEKMTLNVLKQTVNELRDTLKEQTQKNAVLENGMKQLRKELDLMTTRMADLSLENQQIKQQKMKGKQQSFEIQVKQLRNQLIQRIKKLEDQKLKDDQHRKTQQQKLKLSEFKIKALELRVNELSEKYQQKLKAQQQTLDNQKAKPQALLSQIQPYYFSSTHKRADVTLQSNIKVTKNTQSSGFWGLALVEGIVNPKGSSIRFLIDSIGGGLALGLTIRNVISQNNYKIQNWNVTGSGCFLLYDNSRSLSHSNSQHIKVKTDITFSKGDVIKVTTNDEELLFENETKNKELKMKIKLTEDDWTQACFCVYLAGRSGSKTQPQFLSTISICK